MLITLPPISRRRFLAGSMAVGAGLLLPQLASAQTKPANASRIILLSDVHIDARLNIVDKEVDMADNLTRVVKAILALDPKPACVIINGDCAHSAGKVEDYAALVNIIKPLREAGMPIHLTVGNHDNRHNFWKAIPESDRPDKPLQDQQTMFLEFPEADVYMLDSLIKTHTRQGIIGETQLTWMSKSLDARPDKPAIVMSHHDPDKKPEPTGISDTKALLAVLSPRKQVKALIYGHTHDYTYAKQTDGTHWMNLPPTAYVFKPGRPSGWVDLMLAAKGANVELISLDEKHPQHGDKHSLDWR